MSTHTKEEMSTIHEAARLAGFLPVLKEYTDKMERALENRTFLALNQRTLTPEMALQAWMEKHAYRQLVSRVEQGIAMGTSMTQRKPISFSPLPI